MLRCILFSNRSGAFARAGRWTAAVLDVERALEEEQTYPKAYARLGVALLGCRENEKAAAFATALKSEIRQLAREGKHACSSCPNGFPWPPKYVATDFCVILADLQRPAASSCYLRMKPGFMAFMPQSFSMTS